MSKKVLTTKAEKENYEKKRERLEFRYQDYTEKEYEFTIDYAFQGFMMYQREKGSAKATIEYYKRFYKKFSAFIDVMGGVKETPITTLTKMEGIQGLFMSFLGDVNIQTINNYLRAYRSFGNFCEKEGYIDGFKCQIKEVEPSIKKVYTEEEIKRLLVKPNIVNFEEYRNFVIINLLLSTGARSNTILNIKMDDVDVEEGIINFNTTKAHKTAIIPIEKKALRVIKEYISHWGYAAKDGYLFFNRYGEQLTRGGLCKAIANYNASRNVEKTSIHLFRHTFAKRWITNGGDIFTLQRILTHSELDMVKKYLNLYSGDLATAVNTHSIMAQTRTRSGATIKTIYRNIDKIAI